MPNEDVQQGLTRLFSTVFYPGVVIGVFVSLGLMLLVILFSSKGSSSFIRRAIAGILPFVVLVFYMMTDQASMSFFEPWLQGIPGWGRFVIGAATGVLLMETGKQLRWRGDTGASIYALFVGIVTTFLIWAMIGGMQDALHPLLAGLVIGGGLHVVFRGLSNEDSSQ